MSKRPLEEVVPSHSVSLPASPTGPYMRLCSESLDTLCQAVAKFSCPEVVEHVACDEVLRTPPYYRTPMRASQEDVPPHS